MYGYTSANYPTIVISRFQISTSNSVERSSPGTNRLKVRDQTAKGWPGNAVCAAWRDSAKAGVKMFTIRKGHWEVSRVKRILSVTALTGIVIASSLSAAGAQDATPAPLSTDPSLCTIEPTTVEALQAMYGTPAAAGAGEANSLAESGTPEVDVLPTGTPADEALTAEITAAIQRQFACNNSGNLLASLAGISEHFISTEIGNAVFDEDLVAALEASPVPVPADQQVQLLAVRDVTLYEDGRAGALIDYTIPNNPEGINGLETDLFIFVNEGGVWLLDDSFENLEGTYGPDATPAA